MSRYIDADAIEYTPAVEDGFYRDEKYKVSGEFTVAMFTSKDQIDSIPTADVEPVQHGHIYQGLCDGEWSCSVCHASVYWSMSRPWFKYCPNCGAKMDGKEESEHGT